MSGLSGLARLMEPEIAQLYRNAANWPLPGKALLGGALVGLLWVVGNTFYLSGSREQLHALEAQQVALEQQVALTTSQAFGLESQAHALETMQGSFDNLLRQLPANTEVPGLLEDITRLGAANGLVLEAIELLDEQPRPLYIESPLQISVTGTFHDLASFINGMAGLPRVVTVHDLAFSHVEPSLLRLSLVAKIYRYNPQAGRRELSQPVTESGPQQPVAYDFASLRDPFQPTTRQSVRPVGRPAAGPDLARPRAMLEGFAVDQFEMVGTLSMGAQTFALLRGASSIHRLAIGDYLGPHHGRITAIHDAHVELAELFPDGQGAWLERSQILALNNVNS
ncbi:pilus assembly protein PilP [Pseudomonas sp. Bout1]|uniref:pilus assembly protein PilP n=1 Tax=Pseudomonas sp. Bout1 TaxID=3048600 RepID=UPI002AB59D75|nr:pilus assembly protein PilP [Pseudomonas sp. Bout1]MDY7530466.1 pilus assembly protein PilP [Pseudomonas sp. Bout1]MEB0187054.1 pilus assembly protein PilP [Pseudomonas sp. Bout1]